MKSFTSILLGILTLVDVVVYATPIARTKSPPVCVIGAGPAGLTVAANLEKKGKQLIVFEQKSSVGGKCQAVYKDNNYFPLGALLFSNGSYPETLKVVNKVGVPATPLITGPRWQFNWTNGVIVPPPNITVEFATLVGQELQRYAQYWTTVFQPYSALRYKNGVPAEFAVTTADWLATNNFRTLPVLFMQAMVSFGYGDLRQTPILYMLQYLTPDLLAFFVGAHGVYLIDFHEVFVRFARQSVKGRIVLNSNIKKIDRSGNCPIIEYKTTIDKRGSDRSYSPSYKQTCSSVVLAFPPTVEALANANLKLSPEERTVFSPVGITDYWAGATRLNTPQELTFAAASVAPNTPVTPAGQPVYWLKLWQNSNIATSWSWGPYRGGTTTSTALRLLLETFSKFNKDPREVTTSTKTVKASDVLGFTKTDYFPHFDVQQLRNGWYAKYNALQGKQKTYYTSGLNGFETVEFAIRGANDLVESFF